MDSWVGGKQVSEDVGLGHGRQGVTVNGDLTTLKVALLCDTVLKLCHPKHKRTVDQPRLQLQLGQAACFWTRTKIKMFPRNSLLRARARARSLPLSVLFAFLNGLKVHSL